MVRMHRTRVLQFPPLFGLHPPRGGRVLEIGMGEARRAPAVRSLPRRERRWWWRRRRRCVVVVGVGHRERRRRRRHPGGGRPHVRADPAIRAPVVDIRRAVVRRQFRRADQRPPRFVDGVRSERVVPGGGRRARERAGIAPEVRHARARGIHDDGSAVGRRGRARRRCRLPR